MRDPVRLFRVALLTLISLSLITFVTVVTIISYTSYNEEIKPNLNTPAPTQTDNSREFELPTSTLQPTPVPTPEGNYQNTYITYYGFNDNDPPGRNIAYPKNRYSQTKHNQTGGIGTFNDPISFASDPEEWPIGTILYVPYLKKYIVMEDWCAGCVDNWQDHQKHHLDIWMESDGNHEQQLLECESKWTRKVEKVEVDPPSNRPVDTSPLFNVGNGECR